MAERSKVAIVTGAGTGVGKAISEGLLKAGYSVVMAGRRRDALEAAERDIAQDGATTLIVPTDVADPDSVAALFATLSRYNGYEGRDPAVITDSLKCGVAAGHLGMSVDALAQQLAELEARGLIEPCDKGLRLLDVDALERLVDGRD